MEIQFSKYQGTGNDFILLDDRSGMVGELSRETIARWCHRRFGIGADGLMFLGSLDSVNGLSSATPKPKCPWCQSSNFNCEKNLVQHLASAIRKIGVAPSKTTSCRFSAVLHSEVMGKASGVGTEHEAAAFMRGYKKCFVSGELVGFDPHRCAAAAEYLAHYVSQ